MSWVSRLWVSLSWAFVVVALLVLAVAGAGLSRGLASLSWGFPPCPQGLTPAVSRANSRSDAGAEAVGVGSSALLGPGLAWDWGFARG